MDSGERVFFNNSNQAFILPGSEWDLFVLDSLTSGVPVNILAEEIAQTQSVPHSEVLASISKLAGLSEEGNSVASSNQHIYSHAKKENSLPCLVSGYRAFEHTRVFIGFTHQDDHQAFERIIGQTLVVDPKSIGCDVLVERTADKYTVCTANDVIESQIDLNLALLFAFNVTEDIAAKRKDALFIAHAGAVYDSHLGAAAIFPALGHAGKSTLMCSLAMHNYSLINDDVVPVSHDGRLHSLSSIVKLRHGSWGLFDEPIQPLCTGGEFVNGNERLKLVDLTRVTDHGIGIQPNDGFPCKYLIVPTYAPSATPSVQPISTIEALRALVLAESIFRKPATVEEIRTILEWLGGLACYRIEYGTLTDAHLQIDKIFNEI